MQKYIPILLGLLTILLYAASFPPFDGAEAAYLFALPLLGWSYFRPRFKTFALTALLSGALSWLILIIWLRHVTWVGTVLLALILSLFFAAWFCVAYWALPRLVLRPFLSRVLGLLGLAGLWVVLEWLRSFIFTGFPWLPLAASQWQRPVMLQLAAWSGAYGISFLLIFFNLALAVYGYHLKLRIETNASRKSHCPELYLAISLLLATIGLFVYSSKAPERETLFTAGVVQPNIPQSLKWDTDEARNNLDILARQTTLVNALEPEVLFWPETSIPWPILGEPLMLQWVEKLVREQQRPLLLGSFTDYEGLLHNGVFLVTPETGLESTFYFKRKLVPFGEYLPLRGLLPFIDKAVPFQQDFIPGKNTALIAISTGSPDSSIKTHRIGSLVCYEDVFPHLARASALDGADILFVATNNAWYGEEGGAYQHAAHSVLRAVETRRPVIRCGNGGWSGWIDEYGRIRAVATDADGSIYFRGSERMTLDRDPRWRDRKSFYVHYGDWFVAVCMILMLIGGWITKRIAAEDKTS